MSAAQSASADHAALAADTFATTEKVAELAGLLQGVQARNAAAADAVAALVAAGFSDKGAAPAAAAKKKPAPAPAAAP
jgi:hypothetical protein